MPRRKPRHNGALEVERIGEYEGFRRSLEEKLAHAREGLEHFRTAAREQREQPTRRRELQVQQLQAELQQVNQTAIVSRTRLR